MARTLLLLCLVVATFGQNEEVTEAPSDAPSQAPSESPEPSQCAASRFLPELADKDFAAVLQCPLLDCSHGPPRPRDCDVKIASPGGGISSAGLCEGTIAAATEALAQGATSLNIPICLSRDNVPFVWYDCNMTNAQAVAHRLGKFTTGKCVPFVHPSVIGKSAHELDFADIQRFWGYRSHWTQCSRLAEAPIPSLDEYLGTFKTKPISFVLIHYRSDFSTVAIAKLMWLASKVMVCHGLQFRTLISVPSPLLVPAVQCAMADAGAMPGGVGVRFSLYVSDVADEAEITATMTQLEMGTLQAACSAGAPELPLQGVQAVNAAYGALFQIALQVSSNPIALGKLMKKFQPVSAVKRLCIYGVFITRPGVPNGEDILKLTVMRGLERRNRYHPNLHIFLELIDSHKEMAWAMRHGVDGFLTGNVAVARVVHDTVSVAHCDAAHRPDHCTALAPSASPPPPPPAAVALSPPPYITECLGADGQFTELNTFNKVLHCWAKLLKIWSVSHQSITATTPGP